MFRLILLPTIVLNKRCPTSYVVVHAYYIFAICYEICAQMFSVRHLSPQDKLFVKRDYDIRLEYCLREYQNASASDNNEVYYSMDRYQTILNQEGPLRVHSLISGAIKSHRKGGVELNGRCPLAYQLLFTKPTPQFVNVSIRNIE